MKRVRCFFGVLAALLAAGLVLLAGCQKKAAEGSGAGPVVVNFYEHSDNESIINQLVEKFNATHSNIRVVSHIVPDGDYDDKVKVMAQGNSGEMDAFWIRTPSQVQLYISNKVLVELGSYARKSGLDLAPIEAGIKAVSDSSGKFYGLPTTGSCWMIFYNKDLFDAAGEAYPENLTWAEYTALAKKLTGTRDGEKYWGGLVPPWMLNIGSAAAGEYLTQEALPRTREYLEVLRKWYVDDKSHPGLGEMSQGAFDVYAYFAAGNIFMMINGDWSFNLLQEQRATATFTFGAAPLPVFPGIPAGSSIGQASVLSIPRSSKHPEEAWEFIKWATTSAEGTSIYASSQNVPSYPTDEALAVYKQATNVPGVDYRFAAKIGPETGPEPYYSDISDAFSQEAQLYLLGEQSLDKTFSNFYTLRKEVLDNNR